MDLIDRKLAIDIAKYLLIQMDEYHQYNQAINNYCAELGKLPSSQPEIIRCRDCAWSMKGDFSKKFFCSFTGGLTWAEPDSFCNYAERKKDG